LSALLAIQPARAQDDSKSVIAALTAYRAALKSGDVNRVLKLTVAPSDYPIDRFRARIEHDVTRLTKVKLWIFPESAKVSGDCAVVVVGDGAKPTPDDPAYLLKQDGQWKVLPEVTQWKDEAVTLTEKQEEAFTQLTKVYEETQKQMRAEKPKNLKVE
jgi:hypothetical protein